MFATIIAAKEQIIFLSKAHRAEHLLYSVIFHFSQANIALVGAAWETENILS